MNNLCKTTLDDIFYATKTNNKSFTKIKNEKEFSERLFYIIRNAKWVLLYDTKKNEDKLSSKNYIVEAAFLLTYIVDEANTGIDKDRFHQEAFQIIKECSAYLDKLSKFTVIKSGQYKIMKSKYGL